MAKNARYRWQGWGLNEPPRDKKPKGRKKSGITNAQAKYLAALQRQAGVKYTGNGMTKAQAADAIDKLARERDERRGKRPTRRHAPVQSEGWTPDEQRLIDDAMSKQALPPSVPRKKRQRTKSPRHPGFGIDESRLHEYDLELDAGLDAKLRDEAA